ncbi:MAG: hypothetical protein FWB74_10510 [Defluviitaleaceae bacterium]|nr:hypothetical protein [Defluviitaleaceae bacterium]
MAKIKSSPVFFSIIATFIISAVWLGSMVILQEFGQLAFSGAHILFALIAVLLLGKINQLGGFKHTFKIEGIVKSLFALLPVMVFVAFALVSTDGFDFANIENFTLTAFFQTTSSLVQNVLFRGLLVTALLIKLSQDEDERVKSIFIASALYLIIYIPLNIINHGMIGIMQIITTFVVGAGFCSAYLYSKNLLGLVLVQSVWYILASATEGYAQSPFLIIILAGIVAFAVIFAKRAKPFSIN